MIRCRKSVLESQSYLLTYLLTPWRKALLVKLTGSQLVKKYPAFYGTRKFITMFTTACNLPLFWARTTQSMPPSQPTFWRSILILSSHLCVGLPSGLFPSGFSTKSLDACLLSPTQATCPAHLILLDLITQIIFGGQYRSSNESKPWWWRWRWQRRQLWQCNQQKQYRMDEEHTNKMLCMSIQLGLKRWLGTSAYRGSIHVTNSQWMHKEVGTVTGYGSTRGFCNKSSSLENRMLLGHLTNSKLHKESLVTWMYYVHPHS